MMHATNDCVNIKIGELAVSKDKALTTIVGSCIACCIYDDKNKVIGIAHIMLPENKSSSDNNNLKAKYADTAIKNLLDELVNHGADIRNLKAKIVGGSSIFVNENDTDMFNIGKRNADKVKKLLIDNNVKIISEDIGGRNGRNVIFDPNTFSVKIKSANNERVI
jgi:chemotaxis protein CheD